jgi:asparagine synthase (glutamine-hydrolysing)
MSNSYLGGIWTHGRMEGQRCRAPTPEAVQEDWGWVGERTELSVHAAPACGRLFTWDALALFIRGHARPRGSSGLLDLERLAEELRCHYLDQGRLPVEDLDGSFTLALLDGQAGRVVLYRNLIGTGFTYYHVAPGGLMFGGNLAELVAASGVTPRPNPDILPSFFLYRCVPGSDTLFAGFQRLLPGEEVVWDARSLTRVQRQTFADLTRPADAPSTGEAALDQLEETMTAVLRDQASLRPGAGNLLSGGVDSSYLQGVWNRLAPGGGIPRSFSVSVDHPHTWMDTDYAMTASRALGSRHTLTPADGPYSTYLLDALGSTAEPPNHVQSAYFGHLARDMVRHGVSAGLCGEGADSLFGLGLANHVHNAGVLRRLLPLAPLRQAAGLLSGGLGWDRLAYTCRLAQHLEDFAWLEHPVNRVAAFTDWPSVEATFGRAALERAAAARRALLDRFAVPPDPMDRLHAMGFLGEAMDSAGLWTTLFNQSGADLLCPFLDSRLVRFGLSLPSHLRYPFRKPKELLKRALTRFVPAGMARRVKLGFGQPIFEWLSTGGQLRPLVDQIQPHEFIQPAALDQARQRPGWFLYSLLCYDLWHRLFIERSLARPVSDPSSPVEQPDLARAG